MTDPQPLFSASNVRQAVLRGLMAGVVFAPVYFLAFGSDPWRHWQGVQGFLIGLVATPLLFVERRGTRTTLVSLQCHGALPLQGLNT